MAFMGLGPSFGLWPKNGRAQPEPGAKPFLFSVRDGEAEPRRTSGGEAATVWSMTFVHSRRVMVRRNALLLSGPLIVNYAVDNFDDLFAFREAKRFFPKSGAVVADDEDVLVVLF